MKFKYINIYETIKIREASLEKCLEIEYIGKYNISG